MSDTLSVALGVLLLLSAAIPVAIVVAIATRQSRDVVDFTGWTPPDESTETPETALYFDVQWREVTP